MTRGIESLRKIGLHRLGDGVGDADIKTAHLKALKVYHPDKTGKGEDDGSLASRKPCNIDRSNQRRVRFQNNLMIRCLLAEKT